MIKKRRSVPISEVIIPEPKNVEGSKRTPLSRGVVAFGVGIGILVGGVTLHRNASDIGRWVSAPFAYIGNAASSLTKNVGTAFEKSAPPLEVAAFPGYFRNHVKSFGEQRFSYQGSQVLCRWGEDGSESKRHYTYFQLVTAEGDKLELKDGLSNRTLTGRGDGRAIEYDALRITTPDGRVTFYGNNSSTAFFGIVAEKHFKKFINSMLVAKGEQVEQEMSKFNGVLQSLYQSLEQSNQSKSLEKVLSEKDAGK